MMPSDELIAQTPAVLVPMKWRLSKISGRPREPFLARHDGRAIVGPHRVRQRRFGAGLIEQRLEVCVGPRSDSRLAARWRPERRPRAPSPRRTARSQFRAPPARQEHSTTHGCDIARHSLVSSLGAFTAGSWYLVPGTPYSTSASRDLGIARDPHRAAGRRAGSSSTGTRT